MFLDFIKDNEALYNINRLMCTYEAYYDFWLNNLFERIMRLFVWTADMPQKEIEQRLVIQGHVGIAKYKGELTAFWGTFNGVSKYDDEKPFYNVRCPIYAENLTRGKDVIVISNNSIRNSTFALCHHYATLLAHNDVTIVDVLVNMRDKNGAPIAPTEKHKQVIEAYQANKFNGVFGAIADVGMLGVEFGGANNSTSEDVTKLIDTRFRLLKSFYSDIGVKSAFEKRSNTVEEEVEADNSLLLLNISDMIDSRRKGCEEVNKLFGTNWSVKVNPEIDYVRKEVAEDEKKENN